MAGKTIRIYLVGGVPTAVLTAEIINWTGKVIVAPPLAARLYKRHELEAFLRRIESPIPITPKSKR